MHLILSSRFSTVGQKREGACTGAIVCWNWIDLTRGHLEDDASSISVDCPDVRHRWAQVVPSLYCSFQSCPSERFGPFRHDANANVVPMLPYI